MFESRIMVYSRLCKLQGRLDLMLAQVPLFCSCRVVLSISNDFLFWPQLCDVNF